MLNNLWNWLDGKKTAIGAILLIISGIPHLNTWIDPDIIDAIYYIGSMLGAGGVIHKVSKTQKQG